MINIVEKLKNCCPGIRLYSPICGECVLEKLDPSDLVFPIHVKNNQGYSFGFSKEGLLYPNLNSGECLLFPSDYQRDWDKFDSNKFHLEELEVFDKVLYRDNKTHTWKASFISYIQDDDYYLMGEILSNYIIPWNEDTESLWNTTNEAPEQYQWWK